jgi:uncharacterized protein (DUF58 family)
VTTTPPPVDQPEQAPDPPGDGVAPDETTSDADGAGGPESPARRVRNVVRTNRWKGISALVLLAAGVGVGASSPGLLLAALVGVIYVGYAQAGTEPAVDLSVEREVLDDDPDPGDEVWVRVTVTNTGDSTVGDLRLVDEAPIELNVVDGSPRHGTALRPGATATFGYAVEAKRGTHPFGDVVAIARNFPGTHERTVAYTATTTLTCIPPLDMEAVVPLRGLTTAFTGRIDTDTGGDGLEFFATRDYRRGDKLGRVDWNRYARTRDLSTLQFREERMATVVLLLDLRAAAYVRGQPDALHAADRSVLAAGGLFSALLDTGDRVGIAGLSQESLWLPPNTGRDHRTRARNLLATHPALSPTVPTRSPSVVWSYRRLLGQLPADAQVVLLSPVADDGAFDVARRLDAVGHKVTVISPDATARDTISERVGYLRRSIRLTRLREVGVRVVDWGPDERLASALERARRRWSA